MATVTLENLTKEYGELTAVNGVDLAIKDNELLCLLGPSGCGKTTTLRMLGGLEIPTDGTLYIGDESVTNVPPYERDTAMVFQSWALFPSKTVLENVAFGPKMAGVDEQERTEKARRVLETVEMDEFEEHNPTELSGGQKQRVALARSLAVEPEVLLLDEPLSNLDKRLREQLQLELRAIHEQVETTFVYVTHNQNEAFTLADRIGIMNDGELEQVGDPREVYADPKSQFIEEFLGDTNLIDARVERGTEEGVVAETEFDTHIELPPADAGLDTGDHLTVSLRPEALAVERAATDGAVPTQTADGEEASATNALHGTITDVLYRGSSVRFYVQLGESNLFFERSVGDDTAFDTGEDVRVTWDPDDLLVFAAGDRVGGAHS